MRYFLLTLFLLLSAYAGDKQIYKYITPISVELAPKKDVAQKPATEQDFTDDTVYDTSDEEEIDSDNDGDGILDAQDRCPDTISNTKVDIYGCAKSIMLNINFDSGRYNLKNYHLYQLKEFTFYLKKHKDYFVVLYGYTDSSGDTQQNKILSLKRANTVKKALVKSGISEIRLTVIGMGIKDPVADNSTPDGRAKNRRTEAMLLK